MSDYYIQSSELHKKCVQLHNLLEQAAGNDVKYLRTNTVNDYQTMLTELAECESLIHSILKTHSKSSASPSDTVSLLKRNIEGLSDVVFSIDFCSDCARQLSTWYRKRYGSENVNESLHYKANKIPGYVDKFILAYSNCLVKGTLPEFYSKLAEWYKTLDSSNYPLPNYIVNMCYSAIPTTYSVVIEHYVKQSLFTTTFFGDYQLSLYNKYQSYWGNCSYSEIEKQCLSR